MKVMKTAVLNTIGICSFLTLLLSHASVRGQSAESQQWGMPAGGLQMSISANELNDADVPAFRVALRNIGERDVTLNLGMMLANGKVQIPDKIGLTLTDASGVTRRLKFVDKRYPAIVGRVDDYVVPLRVGSTYTLTFTLSQFWSSATNNFQSKLPTGKTLITAQFEGGGAMTSNLDMPGIKLMNFWKGKLESNALAVER